MYVVLHVCVHYMLDEMILLFPVHVYGYHVFKNIHVSATAQKLSSVHSPLLQIISL